MIEPERLADILQELSVRLRSEGGLSAERFSDWRIALGLVEPAGDVLSEQDEADRRDDAQAAEYYDEWAKLLARMAADAARADKLMSIANPAVPESPKNRDLLLAQVAAEGWCVSCWRNDQATVDVARGRYRDLCRRCGEFKASEGRIPPLPVVVKAHRHGWSKITTTDVAQAIGRTA